MSCNSEHQAVPLRNWLSDWVHHWGPVLVLWALLLPHTHLSDHLFGRPPRPASLVHGHQDFTLLQGELRQGEHEDLVEDRHQAASRRRRFLVPQLGLVALDADPGIQDWTAQIQMRRHTVWAWRFYFLTKTKERLPESELVSVRGTLTFSKPTSSLWDVGRNFSDSSTSPTRSWDSKWWVEKHNTV